jgi:hypothetical protein
MAEEKIKITEEHISRLRRKWIQSRNFWTFFVSGTFATTVSINLIIKCEMPEGYDHVMADRHFNSWSTTIALFWGVFVAQNVLKYAFTKRDRSQLSEDPID